MRMRFRETILKCLTGKIALAVGAAMLVGAMLPAAAHAASITTTFPLIDGFTCTGSIAGSTDANLPNGDFIGIGAFAGLGKKPTQVAPTTKSGPIALTLTILVDATCQSQNENGQKGPANYSPCGQATFATGSYDASNKPKISGTGIGVVGTMTVSFSDAPSLDNGPPAPAGSDPFDGCTGVFTAFPDSGGASGSFSLTSLTGTCKSAGHVQMGCRLE
jgi:hypothetical protein